MPLLLNVDRLILIVVWAFHNLNHAGKQYHINCAKGDLAEYLLVPGDPDRVQRIAKFWDSGREVAFQREFRSFTGKYKGVSVSALSSGIGPACMAIAVNEAFRIGVRSFVRVGSTGAIQENIDCGDLIISSAAVRLDGTSNCYVMPEYPAFAHYEVLLALLEAAERLNIRNYHVGVTATTADFYAGQSRRSKGYSLCSQDLLSKLQEVKVMNFEMETATLYTLASIYGLRAGSVCAVFANRCTDVFKPGAGEENAIKVANEGVKILSEWDVAKKKKRKRWLSPSVISD